MAEVDTNMLSQEHADIRREGAEHTAEIRFNVAERAGDIRREIARSTDELNDAIRVEGGDTRMQAARDTSEIIKEGLKGTHITDIAIKDTRYDLASRVENAADRTERGIAENRLMTADRFYGVGRDLADLKQGHATLSKDIELNSLKGMLEAQKNTQFLSDKIAHDGDKTRELINDLKYHDLNRGLVERNAELVNAKHERHHYYDRWIDGRFDQNQAQFAGQWAQLQSQIQAFQSQLQETRQGMVNFGTMAGVGQSSTSNNVR